MCMYVYTGIYTHTHTHADEQLKQYFHKTMLDLTMFSEFLYFFSNLFMYFNF